MAIEGPPAGWYHDGSVIRWWTGDVWGPQAAPAGWVAPDSDEAGRGLAVLAHLGPFFGGFLVPLGVYLSQRDRNEFTRHHAAEALNFQLTLLLADVVLLVGFLGSILLGVADVDLGGSSPSFPWAVLAFVPVIWLTLLAGAVLSLVGAVRANGLVRWRYPVRIRFVR